MLRLGDIYVRVGRGWPPITSLGKCPGGSYTDPSALDQTVSEVATVGKGEARHWRSQSSANLTH